MPWRAERSAPGGWLREARRWVCWGLRRTGGLSPGCRFGFGAFLFFIAVHHAIVLGLGSRHGGIVELSEGSVTVSACFTYLLTYLLTE